MDNNSEYDQKYTKKLYILGESKEGIPSSKYHLNAKCIECSTQNREELILIINTNDDYKAHYICTACNLENYHSSKPFIALDELMEQVGVDTCSLREYN